MTNDTKQQTVAQHLDGGVAATVLTCRRLDMSWAQIADYFAVLTDVDISPTLVRQWVRKDGHR